MASKKKMETKSPVKLRYSWEQGYWDERIKDQNLSPRELWDILYDGTSTGQLSKNTANEIAKYYGLTNGVEITSKPLGSDWDDPYLDSYEKKMKEREATKNATDLQQNSKYQLDFKNASDKEWYEKAFEKHGYQEKDLRWVLNDAVSKHKLTMEGAQQIANSYNMLYGPDVDVNFTGDIYEDKMWGERTLAKIMGTYLDPNGDYRLQRTSDGKYYAVLSNGKAVEIPQKYLDYAALEDRFNPDSPNYWKKATDEATTQSLLDSGGSGGGNKTNPTYNINYGVDTSRYEKEIKELRNQITELLTPKKYTADELADYYGVKNLFDYNNILRMYTDATNQYYGDVINKQNEFNREALLNSSLYANELMNKYNNSYKYAAPTAIGKGTKSANLLKTLLGTQQANEEEASNLNSLVNDYRERWARDLESDASLARTEYDNLRKDLLSFGKDWYASDVKNNINHMKAYDERYAGNRNNVVTANSQRANAYASNANAAIYNNANAAQKANTDMTRWVVDQYTKYLTNGSDPNAAARYYNNMNKYNNINADSSASAN